jgi:hypothetical protein
MGDFRAKRVVTMLNVLMHNAARGWFGPMAN